MKNYAVKIVNKKKVDRDILKHELIVLKAIKVLSYVFSYHQSRVYNEHLVTIHEIYEDDYLIHIVMEYLGGGDLYERISKRGFFTEPESACVIRHIGEAVKALHVQNIFHLDIKPENVIYVSQDLHLI